ncbi:MAG: ATP-binding cassette domain-containing protein [Clostridia bacterium]|nr:ATP-binding cassette domain-containing protein [Clostridia bacterium]
MIELKSVCGSCGSGKIQNISFRLPNGKTYGILSSRYEDAVCLCALMAGARKNTEGSVLVGGFDLHKEAKKVRKNIGYLSADLLPDNELTPIEYLMAVAEILELPFDKTLRYAHELLELADLADKKDRLIANLTYGEKRILCLLQILLGKPEFLILTSPLSNLPSSDATKMRELIAYFGETCTVFLCAPSLADLREMSDEIIVLQDSTLATISSPDDSAWLEQFSFETAPSTITTEPAKKQKVTPWSILTQKSNDFEMLDTNEKEDKN